MDLLLHLIRRDKIDIYDIPISRITREYLSYIEIMQELQLEVAGEFFVMAATLMRIKALMLLPRRVEEEEEEDPRNELVRNILEYKKFKEAALHLAEREEDRRKVFSRPFLESAWMDEESELLEVSLFDLLGAFRKVLDELKTKVTYRVEREKVTVEETIENIRRLLERRSEVLFTELFDDSRDKMTIIVTFLALLEMIRIGELRARQMKHGGDIWLYTPETPPVEVVREIEDGTTD